nr:exodeoxyribonuclease VII small subunit [Kineosporia rhizophila]
MSVGADRLTKVTPPRQKKTAPADTSADSAEQAGSPGATADFEADSGAGAADPDASGAAAAPAAGPEAAGAGAAAQPDAAELEAVEAADAAAAFRAEAAALDAELAKLSYEEARDELVGVVRRLESGAETLEGSLALWERGEALARRCETWLAGAQAKLDARLPADG